MCDSSLKYLCVALVFILALSIGGQVLAADVPLTWNKVSRADAYSIDMSVDGGVTWTGSQPAGDGGPDPVDGHFTYLGAPEDTLVLFRISALTSTETATRTWSGAWYDHRRLPLATPGGAGIP